MCTEYRASCTGGEAADGGAWKWYVVLWVVWAFIATALTTVARGEPTSCPGIAPTVRR